MDGDTVIPDASRKKNIEEHSDVSKPAEITSQVFGYFFKIDKEEQCKRFSWILATQGKGKVIKGMGMGHSHIKRKRAAYHAVACQIALRGGLSDIPWVLEFQLDVRKSMHAENSLRPAPPSGPPPWHLY